MKHYKDYDGVKQKLKTYSQKTGLKYRNMGCQESNNYCRLTRRMKKQKIKSEKIYTFKQGSLEGYPNLKKIENKFDMQGETIKEVTKRLIEYIKTIK